MIAIGSDHRGVFLKEKIIKFLKSKKEKVVNCGTDDENLVDYPDIAGEVCEQILTHSCDYGILICGTGIGMSIAANRFSEIRAALCTSENQAKCSKEHNNANILVLGAEEVDENLALEIVDVWLKSSFSGKDRYIRRLQKIR